MRLTIKTTKVKDTDPLNNPKGFVFTEPEYITDDTKCMKNKYITKLGQLEDIEEEIGIDLITLFEALKEGIYTIQYGKVKVCCIGLGGLLIEVNDNLRDTYCYCEYGKTWALTEEELL